MAATTHFISVVDPSNSAFVTPGAAGGGVVANLHTSTTTTANDLLEVRWNAGVGPNANTVISKKDLIVGLQTIIKFVIAGGYAGFTGPGDSNIPN